MLGRAGQGRAGETLPGAPGGGGGGGGGRSRSRQLPPLAAAASTRGPPGSAVPRRAVPPLPGPLWPAGPRSPRPRPRRAPRLSPGRPHRCRGAVPASPARRAPPRLGGRAAGPPCPHRPARTALSVPPSGPAPRALRLHLWRGSSPAGPRPQRQPKQSKSGPFPWAAGRQKWRCHMAPRRRAGREGGKEGRGGSPAPPGFASRCRLPERWLQNSSRSALTGKLGFESIKSVRPVQNDSR